MDTIVFDSPWVDALIFAGVVLGGLWLVLRWQDRKVSKAPLSEPLSHVRTVREPSDLEDLLHLSWWQAQADNLDRMGRPRKVGVDVHAKACDAGTKLEGCKCGLAEREGGSHDVA